MMMITLHPNPTVQIPRWDDPTDHMHSLSSVSNSVFFDELEMPAYDDDVPLDAFASDHFRMYEFKVRRCARGRSHDWTECPYHHPGEKARRRDPRKFHYSGNPCPELRKGTCQRGDTCEFAHGVFECWLHPSRYRTQPCRDGVQCRRRICFFAHTPDQLRLLSPSVSSPSRVIGIPKGSFGSSPPMSPVSPVNELTSYVRNLQIGNGPRFCSPRSLRPGLGYTSLVSAFDVWDEGCTKEEEPVMERVESGKELRAKIYAKLTRENSLTLAATLGTSELAK